jgi:hypothetical protein
MSVRESCYENCRRYRPRTCVRICGAKCNLLLERVKNDDEEKRQSSYMISAVAEQYAIQRLYG